MKPSEEENPKPKNGRPQWAQKTDKALHISSENVGGMDATVRPPPLIKPSVSNAAKRTTRDPPSKHTHCLLFYVV